MDRQPSKHVAAALLVSVALFGCKREPEGEAAEAAVDPASMSLAPAETDVEGPTEAQEPPKSLDDVSPVIREAGDGGALSRVVIELARPVAEGQGVAGKGTKVLVDPPFDQEPVLRFTGPTTLELIPAGKRAFANDTRYTIRVEALDGGDGKVIGLGEKRWEHTFRTPPFRLERVSFVRFNPKTSTLEVDLVFTGPAAAAIVEQRGSVLVRGERAPVKVRASERTGVLSASVTHPRLAPGVSVQWSQGPVPSAQDRGVEAAAATRTVEIPDGDEVRIMNVHPGETADGFVFHVLCNDEGAGKRQDYHWDEHVKRSFNLSTRCLLSESAASEHVHISPDPGPTSISPARGGFQIHAPFARGAYTLRIDAGAHSVDGGVLQRTHESTLTVPARQPRVDFVAQGRYLPRSAWSRLALRHLNLEEATLEIRHVPPENLLFWMTGHGERADQRTSEVVTRRKLAFRGESDEPGTAWLDLASMLPQETKGLLEIAVRSNGARGDVRRLVLTDMNLVAKRGKKDVQVWAFGMHDLKPLSGAEVKLVSQSGLALHTCRTDGEGGCRLELPEEDEDKPREAYALIATRDGDLTYLKFADLRTEIADAQVQGAPFAGENPYRAALYSDRGVYRPGETAHLVALVRDGEGKLPKVGMPVELQLLDPKRNVLRRLVLKTDSVGMLSEELAFGDWAETGRYVVQLLAGKRLLGSYAFNVEEFVPERMQVDVSIPAPAYSVTEAVPVEVSARYLFGGSARGSRFEVDCELMPDTFRPKQRGEYEFGVWYAEGKRPRALSVGKATGTLGDEGAGSVSCPSVERGGGFAGPARLVTRASVFEAGSGRTTVNEASVPVHPERFYVGLKSNAQQVEPDKPFRVEGVVVGWDGGPLRDGPDEVDVTLHRVSYEYGWSYDEGQGTWQHRYHPRRVRESSRKAKVVDGRFSLELKSVEGASLYVVSAAAQGARTDLALESKGHFYYWGYGWNDGQGDRTPKPAKATGLVLELPDDTTVGEQVTVKTKAPYPGRMLFTVETDRILRHTWQDVQAGEVEWSFTISDFVPNAYVSAFLIKDPHLDSKEAFLPDRAFGVRSVRVEPTAFTQEVKLEVPEVIPSSSTLQVKLSLGGLSGPTFATVAAVDEGILQLTRFKSPDPLAQVFERRALGVETFETVGWNLLLPAGDASRSHGGGDDAGLGRVQMVKPVALWSGVVEVPASGELTVPLEVPQYRGQLRVMVVTASGERIGRASADVKVRDPIVLQSTLPRFLVAGDAFEVPVFLTNLSGKAQEVEVTLRTEEVKGAGVTEAEGPAAMPPIALAGEPRRVLALADGESGRVVFAAKASQASGAARFRVQAKAGTTVVHEELEVPFAPAGAKVRRVQRVRLDEARTDVLRLLEGWEPTTESSTLWVTNNPYGDAFDHLKYLLRYPYGCIEQTTSSTRPLLYVRNLLGQVDPEAAARHDVEDMVMAGVDRVLSMQTPSGGFAYWPGGSEPVTWSSAYATHMLLDAMELEYAVPKARVDEALDWMEKELTYLVERSGEGGRAQSRQSEAYLHYVLARAGRARKARMEQLVAELEKRPRSGQREEQLYLVKAGLWLAGDRRWERDLKNPDVSEIEHERANDWTFYSDRRRRGFTLSVFGDLFGGDAAAEPLAGVVAESLRSRPSRWYTTQELVWGITALGKRLGARPSKDFSPAKLLVNGHTPAAVGGRAPDDKRKDRTWNVYRASEHRQLEVRIDDKDKGDLWLILSSEGVRPDEPIKTGGNGLRVERAFYDPQGGLVSLTNDVALGDLLYVVVSLKNASRQRVQNIALVDRLPAGFEIENPRLGRGGEVNLVPQDQLWRLEHMNVRDDRLEVFGTLGPKEERSVLYAVRAVTAGTFTQPPVEAEAMYEPAIWARSAGQPVRIRGPWGE